MSRHTQRVIVQSGRRGLFSSRRSVELMGVALDRPDHFARLLPSEDIALPLIMLPVRLLALGVLYATSAPRRFVLVLAALGVLLLIAH